MDNNSQLKEKILASIEAGKKITLKWDCGGDEALISVFMNNEQLKYDNAFSQELELYLVNYLNLPDTGQFELEGDGEIIQENEGLFIVYESILKGIEDYENEEGGWKEVNEKDETYSGKKELFV
jgi:hypothetical protein